MQTKIKVGLIFILAIFALALVASQNANPDKPALFGLKRVQEKIYLKLKSTPVERVNYMSILLDSRLKELEDIVHSKSYDFVLFSALRYSTTAGQITETMVSNNLTSQLDFVRGLFINHRQRLKSLYDFYPKNTSNLEYKYIEDGINYLDIYLDQLSKLK